MDTSSSSNSKDKTTNEIKSISSTSTPSLGMMEEANTTSALPTTVAAATKSNLNADGSTIKSRLEWTDHTEDLLASWGDVASCYKWLHERAFRKFYTINYWMSLFISVFSIITGSTSLGMQSLVPMDYVSLASKIVGGVNLITGIVTQIQANFRYAQLSESHQNSSIGWNKLERNIRIELKIDRKNRKDAEAFIRMSRAEYDRLLEQSPVIPEDIIEMFKQKFTKRPTTLVVPDICDNLQHCEITKPSIEDEVILEVEDDNSNIEDNKQDLLFQIKQLLADSRIVPMNINDHELPTVLKHKSFGNEHHRPSIMNQSNPLHNLHNVNNKWNRHGSDIHLIPRHSFAHHQNNSNSVAVPVRSHSFSKDDLASTAHVSVKDLLKKFEHKRISGIEITPNFTNKQNEEEQKIQDTSTNQPIISIEIEDDQQTTLNSSSNNDNITTTTNNNSNEVNEIIINVNPINSITSSTNQAVQQEQNPTISPKILPKPVDQIKTEIDLMDAQSINKSQSNTSISSINSAENVQKAPKMHLHDMI
jgi:hypothetical protein